MSMPVMASAVQTSTNPLGKHAMVFVWECVSSGGQQWVCESVLSLHSLAVSLYNPKASAEQVLMDWLPMENGSCLLATCFSSIISIFGMAMPIDEEALFSRPPKGLAHWFSKSVSMPVMASAIQTSANHLGKHAMVFVWECESVLSLHSLGVSLYDPKASAKQVLMDWLPNENGSCPLATCFSSIISIFGIAVPIDEEALFSRPPKGLAHWFSQSVSMPVMASAVQTSTNPLGKHAMVFVWECESSSRQQWVFQSVLSLHSLGVNLYDPKASAEQVLMDWLPMENPRPLQSKC